MHPMESTAAKGGGEDADDTRSSLWESITDVLPNVNTTKSVWEVPKLHHEILDDDLDYNGSQASSRATHRGENWYELFYDLIYVAAAIQMGTILKHDIAWQNVAVVSLIFLIFRRTWAQLNNYQNRFDTYDAVHYIFYLFQGICVFVMAIHLTSDNSSQYTYDWHKTKNLVPFSTAAGLSRLSMALIYIQVIYFNKKYRFFFILTAAAQFISAILFFSIPASTYLQEGAKGSRFMIVWLIALIVERPLISLLTTVAEKRYSYGQKAPLHLHHMLARQGTFILLILGEAVIQLVQTTSSFGLFDYLRGIMGFTIVFNVGDCYYQQQLVGKENPGRLRDNVSLGWLWEGLHDILSLLILLFAVGVKLVYAHINSEDSARYEENFMCSTASASLILIFFLRMMHKGFSYKGLFVRRWSYLFRLFICISIAFVPTMTASVNSTIYITFALTTVLVLQDTFSHRGWKRKEQAEKQREFLKAKAEANPASLAHFSTSAQSTGNRQSISTPIKSTLHSGNNVFSSI